MFCRYHEQWPQHLATGLKVHSLLTVRTLLLAHHRLFRGRHRWPRFQRHLGASLWVCPTSLIVYRLEQEAQCAAYDMTSPGVCRGSHLTSSLSYKNRYPWFCCLVCCYLGRKTHSISCAFSMVTASDLTVSSKYLTWQRSAHFLKLHDLLRSPSNDRLRREVKCRIRCHLSRDGQALIHADTGVWRRIWEKRSWWVPRWSGRWELYLISSASSLRRCT